MTPSLQAYLHSLGQEYAPFDPLRMPRIYEALKKPCGFERAYGAGLEQGRVKVIHIIGTNGKGSTGRFLTMGLEQNKKRVLHFTSPHLFDFAERFYINGGVVDSEVLEAAHRELYAFEIAREASYFEYATLLGLILARECEFLVLEAGLGGEFDSTNVLCAHLSVFTPIGLDHQELLGSTLEAIATTKLKAMKSLTLLAKQETQVEALAKEIAAQKGVKCYAWGDFGDLEGGFEGECGGDVGEGFERDSENLEGKQSDCRQGGKLSESKTLESKLLETQISESKTSDSEISESSTLAAYVSRYALSPFLTDNLALAQRALRVFGMDFDFENLAGLSLRGRCEKIAPNIIIDVGHNLPAARALKAYAIKEFGLDSDTESSTDKATDTKLHLVYNSYEQKDIEAILREFLPIVKKVLIISVENSRICPRQRLVKILEDLGLEYEDLCLTAQPKPQSEIFKHDEFYLVFGSFSVVGEFLQHYKE